MKYKCKLCYFETDKLDYLNKHRKSKKHIILENKLEQLNHKCIFCNSIFSQKSSLNRHLNYYCTQNIDINTEKNNDLQKKVDELKIEMERKNFEIEKIKIEKEAEKKLFEIEKSKIEAIAEKNAEKRINSILIKDKEHTNYIQKENTKIIETSINSLAFLRNYFSNAPPIHIFKNTKSLFMHNKSTKGEFILHYFKKKKLVKYIGNELLKEYKKEDPHDQALWASDVMRKNIIYNKKINGNGDGNNDKTKWMQDKSGVHVGGLVIDPIITTIKQYIDPFKKMNDKDVFDDDKTEKLELAHKLDDYIDNNSLKNDIITYISPHIYLDKEKVFNKNNIKDDKIVVIDDENKVDESDIDTEEDSEIEPVNKPIEKPKEKPVDKPKEKPVDKPKEKPVDKPKKKLKNKLDLSSDEESVVKSKDKPIDNNTVFIKQKSTKEKIVDKNGRTISSEHTTPFDSDKWLEAVIGRKLKKQ